jgi:undecaprenyl-diphosphatase
MILLEILLLAFVQGVAEFLPISSSGHIVVGTALFDQLGVHIEEKLSVNIILHMGTLLAILVFYRRRIWGLLGADRRVIWLLVVGTLPAALVGPVLKMKCEQSLENPLLAGLMFPITGAALLWSARARRGSLDCRQLGWGRALLIGAAQALAILPGISRSGATIVAGLASGLKRDEAAAFSFLLAIPAIGGAGFIESLELLKKPIGSTPPLDLAIGAVVSFAVGLVSLWWLVRWLQEGRLHRFAWYLLILGPIVVVWQLW